MIAFGIFMIVLACIMAFAVAECFYDWMDWVDIVGGIFIGLIDTTMLIGGIAILVAGIKLANVQL